MLVLLPRAMARGSQNPPAPGQASPPAALPPPSTEGWTTRLGEACLLGLGVASLAAVPTGLRTAGSGGAFLEGILVGAAALLPLITLALALARAAGRGFRGIVGQGSARLSVLRIALWIGVAMPLLAGLAALLKAVTNHRGLAGATFGVFGLLVVAAAALVAHRLVVLGERLAARGTHPWLLSAAGTAIGVVPLLIVASPLASGGGEGSAQAIRAALVDGAIALVATALVASLALNAGTRRAARLAGVPAAALVLISAAARLESSPPLGRAVRAGGGLAATLLGALERWTDRDGDGEGAHFGGHDCDEGDSSRHPSALEIPGDGIDQDCDGIDPEHEAPLRLAAVTPTAAATAVLDGVPALTKGPGAASPSGGAGTAGDRPDIVLVTLDTVRADHTSAYGYERDTTPRLKELASRGVLFERAYAPGSDTQRAIAPLVMGRRLSSVARDRREWPTLFAENDSVAERLKRAGYVTGAVSSFTWISEERGFAQGFDRFEEAFRDAHPEREVTGQHAVRRATHILEAFAKRTEPLFLWVHLFDAHDRYVEHRGIRFGKGPAATYDGEIAYVDQQVGALVEAITTGPRARKTAIIVHGSHGEALGEHDVSGHGVEVYEEAIRVPLVIVLPPGHARTAPAAAEGDTGASAGGQRYKTPVSTVDIAPTILEIAAAQAEAKGIEGSSLLAVAQGDLSVQRSPVYVRGGRRGALIDWPLKLVVVERKKRNRHLLFDLDTDPGEQRDLSSARGEDRERMVTAWEEAEAKASAGAPAR
ncbi:sulfatase-like hydrolase/transferase [Chondromyces crocatus]|uniref:Cell wall surface anchor family protein n=1 Tax=Chondromyces crocatus TaxID=52 RepID=A0A0K1EQR2_CHOCO|nr:sulfatase-like hydrolase/transferase [Chondromyces crocatus]AKT43265.1 cell wall surface anchor family protein [Chondromyces crocatus]